MQQRESERPLCREAKREAKQSRTHGTVTRTTVFEFYDSHAVLCRAVANCALWFGIFIATISSCDAWYRAVMRSWFAIWFAKLFLYRCGLKGPGTCSVEVSLLRRRLTRLVVRDDPTHGGDYLLPCRFRTALRAARDLSLGR